MKRILTIIIAALALTGCAGVDLGAIGDAGVKVAETLTDENTSTAKGITAGMSSSDAANVLNTREYYRTIRAVHGAPTDKAPPLVEIESHDGKPIQIDAKVFRVNAPRMTGGGAVAIAEPREIEPMGFKISREARAWVLGWFGWDLEKDRETTRRLVVTTDAATQRFETGTNANLMRDLVGTKNDPAALDRAEAEKTRAEADRIRATSTPTTTP
jgi:hypothetical protein